ncbi:MAG: glycosyltransferase [Chloroflexi bacterium AL-N1]|nr:glycosyltransferase [Chloroflexi bacterium AL-N1]NOK72290.1 glycosyltransferase [Chloroflexi bacterium AL-N5]
MTERCQMNLALLSAEYPPQPGGVGDYTKKLGEELKRHNQTVHIITSVRRNQEQNSFTVLPQIVLPVSVWNWQCWSAVIDTLNQIRPDVLHIQYQTGAYGMHPAINFLPWRLSRLPGRPRVVVTAHDLLVPYLFPKAGWVRHWVTRRLLADTDRVVVTNPHDYAYIQQHYGRPLHQRPQLIPIGSNIAVAPPTGYDRVEWRRQYGIRANTIIVAYFGLLSSSKGVDTLIDALGQLPPPYCLLIIGGATTTPQDQVYAQKITDQINNLGLAQRVIRTGHCNESDVSAHLLAVDMVALPFVDGASFRRGSLLAALAHGVPVITTRGHSMPIVDGFPQLIDGEQALLVPPQNASALAQAIQKLTNDSVLGTALGKQGQSLAQHFSWDIIADQHIALYENLLAEL